MAAKRYGFMCRYLKENGYEPYVLTVRARGGGYLNAKLDLSIPIAEKNVIRIGDLGIIYPIYNPAINIILHEYSVRKKISRIADAEAIGWYSKIKKELNLASLPKVDLVLGTFPAIGNILVARYIASKLHKPFIAEIRDLISDYEEGFDKNEFDKKMELFIEKKVISRADGIVTVTEGFKNIYIKRYKKKKIVTIYNGWEEIQSNHPMINTDHVENYMYYAGTLYEHRVKSLKLLFDAIKKYDIKEKVVIRSLGPENLDNQLKRYVTLMELGQQVSILKAATEDVIHREQSKAKINLLISSTNENDLALMTTLPGKLFELMRLNQPILAIVHESSEVAQILNQSQKGVAASEIDSINKFLKGDLEKYKGFHENINFFSRKNQAKMLCKFFNEIVR